jgi:hypothetical protein
VKPEPVFVAPVEVVIKAEPEALAVPEVTGESKTSPVKAKGPKPKGTKRFKKLPMDEPEVKEEELSEHQKKKLETQRRKVEEAEAAKLAAELAEKKAKELERKNWEKTQREMKMAMLNAGPKATTSGKKFEDVLKEENVRIKKAEDQKKQKEARQHQADIKQGKVMQFDYIQKEPGFGQKNYVPQTVQVK